MPFLLLEAVYTGWHNFLTGCMAYLLHLRRLIPILAIAGLFFQAHGQTTKKSVIIGTYFDRPNAVLALNPPSKNQGFLLPQLTTQERLSMRPVSPSDDGLMVYDATLKSFFFWRDNLWVKGLGSEPPKQSLTFDEPTLRLSLGIDQTVDLSVLKELPEARSSETGMVLTTDRAGVVNWSDKALFTDNQNLALSGNTLSIDRGVAVDLGALTANGPVISGPINNLAIADASITSADLGAGIVTTDKLASAGADKILTTDGAGKVTWTDKTSMKELPETSASEDGMVLTTDRAGVIYWSDKALFTDSQNLALSGNILNIDRGLAADLGALTTGGSVINGPINNLAIVDGSVTSADLGAGIVTTEKLASAGADKILTTDGAGKVTWADKTSMGLDLSTTNESLTQVELTSNQLTITESANSHSVDFNSISLSGDVSGTVNENNVARIQGNEVQAGTPADGKILKWQAGKWAFADDNIGSVTAAAMTRFSTLDVTEFQETNDPVNQFDHRIYRIFGPTLDFGYMGKKDKIRDIVGGLHLPHGAELTTIRGYVWDNERYGREIELNLMRKEMATGVVVQLASSRSAGASPSVQELTLPVTTSIDNSRYIYFIQIHFDLGNDDYEASKLSQINQRLYGVSYEYTEPGNVISGPGTTQTLYVNSTAPSGPYTGQVWLDTTTHLLKFWDGSAWVQHQ